MPIGLTNGVVMDVRYLETQLPAFANDASWQVWIGLGRPGRRGPAAAQGRAAHPERAQSRRPRRPSSPGRVPALALLLLLACAVAGAALAVGGTAISISASSRRRSYEIAALRAVGVSRRSLLRAQRPGATPVVGDGRRAGRAHRADRRPARHAGHPRVLRPHPDHARLLPAGPSDAVFAGAFVVLLSVTAVIAARALIGIAVPSRLREAET